MSLVRSREQVELDTVNVVSLFGSVNQEVMISDPLQDLISESEIEESVLEVKETKIRMVVNERLFPDQSMYVLEDQLKDLRSSLSRIKFYLDDIDDLLPR